ncbi:MAG: hypothetical protein DRQ44_15865 [Gammaproteobacteria bacterium]|nr:MAG: hypothetical protein DRQ44_15865 [Gammaproteobacteria bacterium]
MPDKNTCIFSYTTPNDALQAFRKLQAQNFNLTAVSIVGNGRYKKEHAVGIYTKDGRSHFQGAQAMFWESLWRNLDGELFIVVPERASLAATGGIVQLLIKEQVDVDIHGFSVLGVALFNMGVPADGIAQYEAAIKAGKILLIVNGKRGEVERSCEVLHSEMQQATVHLA